MFPGREIALKMRLGKDKVGYTVCYGLAPYFQSRLLSYLATVPFLVVVLDGLLSRVSQKEHKDVLVRY